TNIGKISRIFKPRTKKSRVQRVLYQPGLGTVTTTEKDTDSDNLSFNKIVGRILGTGHDTMIMSIYHYLCVVWRPKDTLYFFGFSRGAYLARILASFVADVGILKHDCENLITKIANLFKIWVANKGEKSIYRVTGEYRGLLQTDVEIPFMGVYDTVSSLGAPDQFGLNLQTTRYEFAEQIHDRPEIKKVRHALSLSERRENWKCVMFKKHPHGLVETLDKSGSPRISQVWFPGYHNCVGGGTRQKGNTAPIVSLIWMISKFKDLLEVN
ncbi:hypothetical protein B0T24DRAFT_493180, partial [Lasiosphaeria ovina]